MSNTSMKRERRTLHFENFEQILADAEQLVQGEHETVGQWSLGQIFEHLAITFNASVDGFPFRANWFLRKVVAPLMKNSLFCKPMKSGFKIPKSAKSMLPSEGSDPVAALEGLRTAISRFEDCKSLKPHPFMGNMAESEWTMLHLRHSELHMSFALPGK